MNKLVLSVSLTLLLGAGALGATRPLESNNLRLAIPEGRFDTVNPTTLRVVDEMWFNQQVFPEIEALQFYSNDRKSWFPIPHGDIRNNCFARRMIVDLFLWGETFLAGQIESSSGKIKYLTPFLRNEDFLNVSWIETARIVAVGKLQAGSVSWSNHEAIVINTNLGIRIVDPSFANTILTAEDWFLNFAPIDTGKKCVESTIQGLREINTEMVKENMGLTWNPKVPKCGYAFRQRLDAGDMISGTSGTWGTDLEKMLSRDLSNYMENRLLPH